MSLTRIVVDLETVPTAVALATAPPEEWLTKGIRDNFKPETAEKYRAENEASWAAEIARRASLDWRLGKVCAAGFTTADHLFIGKGDDERQILTDLWAHLAAYPKNVLVGFNLRGFDWPWLMGRSAVLGVEPSVRISESRYANRQMVDWMDILSNFGGFSLNGWTLERYAELFDLPHRPVGQGSEVFGWYQAQNWTAIGQHLEADLRTTWDLDQRLKDVYL